MQPKLDEVIVNDQLGLQKRQAITKQIKSGVDWYYWIAGLSIIHSLINLLFGRTKNNIVGLGLSQLIYEELDKIVTGLKATEINEVNILGFLFTLVIAGIFIVIGIYGQKRIRKVFVLGIIIYSIDAILLLFTKQWIGVLYHFLPFWGLFSGLNAIDNYSRLEKGEHIDIPLSENEINKRKISRVKYLVLFIILIMVIPTLFFLLLYIFLSQLV